MISSKSIEPLFDDLEDLMNTMEEVGNFGIDYSYEIWVCTGVLS